MRLLCFVQLISCVALGCSRHPPGGSAPPQLPAAPAPSVSASAPPVVAAVASTPAGAQTGLPQPSFHLIHEASQPLSLFKFSSGEIVAAAGEVVGRLSDAGIVPDELLRQGLLDSEDFTPSVTGLAGRLPNALWATVVQSAAGAGWEGLYHTGKTGWAAVGTPLPPAQSYVGIGNWSNGRVLLLHGGSRATGPGARFVFQLVAGPAAPLPLLTPTPVPRANDPNLECKFLKALVVPRQLLVLENGHVFVLGQTCANAVPAVEHWMPGRVQGEVHVFPDSLELWQTPLLGRSERDVVFFLRENDRPVLARFDGKVWTTERVDLNGYVVGAELAGDGTLFAITLPETNKGSERQGGSDRPRRLWWRPVGQAAFSELDVPARLAPPDGTSGVTSVAATSAQNIWLVSGDALYHSRPAAP